MPSRARVSRRADAVPTRELLRFTFPRQREGRRLCISDFFAPKSSGKMDVIGLSLVTIGPKASVETQRLFEGGEYTKYLYLHGLSVETAEALAELHHKKMREELGIAGEDAPRNSRPVSSEISRVALFVWLSGVPESGRSDQAVRAAEAGRECRRSADFRIPAGAGAEYFGDRGASSGGKVFRGLERDHHRGHRGTQRKILTADAIQPDGAHSSSPRAWYAGRSFEAGRSPCWRTVLRSRSRSDDC